MTDLGLMGFLAVGLFLQNSTYLHRYFALTRPWERRVTEATLIGVMSTIFFLGIARLVATAAHTRPGLNRVFHAYFGGLPSLFSVRPAEVLFAAVMILTYPLFINQVIDRARAADWVNRQAGNQLRKLLFAAMTSQQPVRLVSKSGHVYVGFVIRGPGFEKDDSYVGILPVSSGSTENWPVNSSDSLHPLKNHRHLPSSDVDSRVLLVNLEDCSSAQALDLETVKELRVTGAGSTGPEGPGAGFDTSV